MKHMPSTGPVVLITACNIHACSLLCCSCGISSVCLKKMSPGALQVTPQNVFLLRRVSSRMIPFQDGHVVSPIPWGRMPGHFRIWARRLNGGFGGADNWLHPPSPGLAPSLRGGDWGLGGERGGAPGLPGGHLGPSWALSLP